MANTKISALPAASTPLAGTELVPIVQGGITEQVSVANLTAGRATSASSLTATSGGVSVKGGPTGYGGDEIAMTTNTSSFCAISTQMTGGSLYFDHRGTGNNANWIWRNGTGASTTRMTLGATGDLTMSTGNIIPSTAAKGINFTANTPQAGMTSQLLNWYEEGTFTPTLSGATTTTYTTQTGRYTRVGRLVTFQCELQINSVGNGSTTTFVLGTLPNAGHFSTVSVGFFSSIATAVSSLFGYVNSGANSVTLQSITVAATTAGSSAIFGNSARIIVSGQYSV